MAWPVSERFKRALRLSHDAVTRVEVWRDGVNITPAGGLPVASGDVTIDEGSKVRRSISLLVADPDLDPDDAEDLLAPFGTELRVWRGVRMTEGDVEEVPVGVFRIDSAKRAGWASGVQVTGGDRSNAVKDARFLAPENTPAGVLVTDEIARLITDAIDVEVFDLTNSQTKTYAATWARDRWDAIEVLANSIGAEVFFDPAGRAIIRTVPRLAEDSEAVWDVDVDEETGALLDLDTGLASAGVYNAVVAQSESAENEPTVTAVAYLSDGPLRWRDGFRIPRFFVSKMLRTVEQAADAARAILARSITYAQTVSASSLPNPALDAGDVVAVTARDGSQVLRIVSKIGLPLEPGAMSLETRTTAELTVSADLGSLD